LAGWVSGIKNQTSIKPANAIVAKLAKAVALPKRSVK
jgi:hypothetical protein